MTERVDVAVVGGGIVGLATAFRLLERRPDLSLAVLEKEAELATHQSGHNSGVIHAGLYYQPGSAKAALCRQGKAELEEYCQRRAIPYESIGKLVVAVDEGELPRLASLRARAIANGVPGLEEVGRERIAELEPQATGLRGLWSPTTGIVDYRRVALALAEDVGNGGGRIQCSRAVTGLVERGAEVVVRTATGEMVAGGLIACAGLQADRVQRRARVRSRGLPAPRRRPSRSRLDPWLSRLPAARRQVSPDGPGRAVARLVEAGVCRPAAAVRAPDPGGGPGVRSVGCAGPGRDAAGRPAR